MQEHTPTHDEALAILKEFNKTDGLLKHAYAVEGVMRYIARKRGEDEEKWGIIGLVHDLDWEKYPEEHCRKTREILTEAGWPEEYIRSIMSHAWGLVTDVKPEHHMEKVLSYVELAREAHVQPRRRVRPCALQTPCCAGPTGRDMEGERLASRAQAHALHRVERDLSRSVAFLAPILERGSRGRSPSRPLRTNAS